MARDYFPKATRYAVGGMIRRSRHRTPEEERSDLYEAAFNKNKRGGDDELDDAFVQRENRDRYSPHADPELQAYAKGGSVHCPACGFAHGGTTCAMSYADGGEVQETMQDRLDRHEAERQSRNDVDTETSMDRLRADRPRVSVDDDERKTRPRPMDTAQASNYARGGRVSRYAGGGEASPRSFEEHLAKRSRLNQPFLNRLRGR